MLLDRVAHGRLVGRDLLTLARAAGAAGGEGGASWASQEHVLGHKEAAQREIVRGVVE